MNTVKERQVIINGEIVISNEPHKDENISNKQWIAELFAKEFDNSFIIPNTGSDKDIYKINIDGVNYNFSFDTTDSGGRSDSRKVGIPYASKRFKELVEENDNVYVVNLYRPLDVELNPIKEKRIWLIIDPMEIYNSNVVINETWNDSSRWVKTIKLLEALNNPNELFKNEKKNVFIAVNNNVSKLLVDSKLRSKYYLMNQIKNDAKTYLASNSNNDIQKIRRSFRMLLIEMENNNQNSSKISNKSLLVASHIHAVEDIKKDKNLTQEQKLFQIGDPHNGLLIPVGLDKLFDKHFITFDNEWKIIISDEVSIEEVEEMCGRKVDDSPWILGKEKESLFYLEKHRERAFSRRVYK